MRAKYALLVIVMAAVVGLVGFLVPWRRSARTSPAPASERPSGAVETRAETAQRGEPSASLPEIAQNPSGVRDRPVFHPRDPDEWQGMLVDVRRKMSCQAPSECGLARGCVRGQCLPCSHDADCDRGEICVLDHCVQRTKADCRKRADCNGPEQMCILSGYSPDPRGNG